MAFSRRESESVKKKKLKKRKKKGDYSVWDPAPTTQVEFESEEIKVGLWD